MVERKRDMLQKEALIEMVEKEAMKESLQVILVKQ